MIKLSGVWSSSGSSVLTFVIRMLWQKQETVKADMAGSRDNRLRRQRMVMVKVNSKVDIFSEMHMSVSQTTQSWQRQRNRWTSPISWPKVINKTPLEPLNFGLFVLIPRFTRPVIKRYMKIVTLLNWLSLKQCLLSERFATTMFSM